MTLLAVSAALLLAFLAIETVAAAPLMPLRIFRLRTVAVASRRRQLLRFIFIGTPCTSLAGAASTRPDSRIAWLRLGHPWPGARCSSPAPRDPRGWPRLRTRPGSASGLLNTSQQLGGAIGVGIASTVFATHLGTLLGQGKAANVALTGGFQWAFWVCGIIAVLALPATIVLFRRPPAAAIPAATEAVRSAASR